MRGPDDGQEGGAADADPPGGSLEGGAGVLDDAFVDARPVTHAGAQAVGSPAAATPIAGQELTLEPEEPSPEVARTLRLSFLEGGLVQVFINWTMGSVLIGYLLELGATPLHIALVGSVGFLAQMASPVAAWVAELAGQRRVLNASLATAGRLCWLVAVFLPQLPVPDAARPTVFVALVFVAGVFNAAASTTWTAWMGDVVPADRRGTFFGRRSGVMGVVGMAANLAGGAFLDRVAPPLSFQLVLLVAVVCALAGAVLILFHHDPPVEKRRLPFGTVLLAPLQDDGFRRFLRFAVYWQFVVMLSNPFTTAYFLESLGMSFTQVAVYTSITAAASLFTSSRWGRIADRVGNKSMLGIGTFLHGALLPTNWILAGLYGDLTFVWIAALSDAVAFGAVGLALFNLALVTAPKVGRVSFIASYSVITGLAGFAGGSLSGPLLGVFQSLDYTVPGWNGFHTLFAVSGIGRMFAWVLLRGVNEPNAWRTRDVLRRARAVWKGSALPWR